MSDILCSKITTGEEIGSDLCNAGGPATGEYGDL